MATGKVYLQKGMGQAVPQALSEDGAGTDRNKAPRNKTHPASKTFREGLEEFNMFSVSLPKE